jgi:hypothetical protein
VIVVLASRYDEDARRLATRWETSGGCLMTCEDLSVSGWRVRVGEPHASRAVLGGREVALRDVRGVLTLLPSISEAELLDITPDDRAYVAAEMTAFLLFWLSGVACPILNRPTPACLTGPSLHAEQWAAAAAGSGMRIRPARQRLCLTGMDGAGRVETASVTVTVVGDRCFGEVDDALRRQAVRLARTTQVDLLGVRFSGPEADATFLGVTSCPRVADPAVADAVLEHFTR